MTQFLVGPLSQEEGVLFRKHVQRIYNELVLCSDVEELMGERQVSAYMCEGVSWSGVVVGVRNKWC